MGRLQKRKENRNTVKNITMGRSQARTEKRNKVKSLTKMIQRAGGKFLDDDGMINEQFLIKNQDILDWYQVSSTQRMSNSFIVRFAKKLNWSQMLNNENIVFDVDFIDEFAEFIDWRGLKKNGLITDEIKEKFADIIEKNIPPTSFSCYASGTTTVDYYRH